MKSRNFRNKNLLKIIVSLLILIFLLKLINFQLLFESLKNINSLIIVALAIIPFSILIRAWRWMIIINKDGRLVSLNDSYKLTLVGVALNIFLPASSGDIAKSYYGYKWHGIKEEMLSSSIADKLIALLAIFILGSMTSFWLKMFTLSIFSVLCALGLLFVVFYQKIVPWNLLNKILSFFLKKNLNEEKLNSSFALPTKIKIFTLLISILAWIVSYIQFFIVCKSFGIEISFIYILAVASLINLAILFPLTLNGIGSEEAMMVFLFGLVNISPTLAIVVSLVYLQLLNTIIPGLAGVLLIMKK
jgi:glycosyltransferase 2 family protein